MYLSELNLWNFRKYGSKEHLNSITTDIHPDLSIKFNKDLNVLIGENDSGKTAIIDAIKHVLNTKSLEYLRLEEKDFFEYIEGTNRKRASELKIECKFRINEAREAGSFLEWIGFVENKETEEKEYELTVWLTASRKDQSIITNIRAGQDDEGVQLDGEARENLKVTYLKPLRDALSELTPGYRSRLAEILGSHSIFRDERDEHGNRVQHKLEEKVEKANEEIRDYFDIDKNENDPENKEFKGGEITKEIKDLLDGLSFKNSANEPAIELSDDELSEILKSLKLVNDSNKSGLGSLNKLYMAAEFLLLNQSKGRDLKLALIEELEAHLHPQAQLKVIDALQRNNSFQGQLILTTHSTTLASKISLENLILCNENDVFPMQKGLTKLDEKDYEFLERFLDSTKANLFFAKGVLMVEGDAENLLIPTIAEIIERPLYDYGVSIVNIGSTAFRRFASIFQRSDGKNLKIPVSCITDLDIALKTSGDKVISKRKIHGGEEYRKVIQGEREKKGEGIISDYSNVFISPLWTLEYDILNSENITREYLFTSILEAQLIKNRSQYYGLTKNDCEKKSKEAQFRINSWKEERKTTEWIACKIYSKYLDNKRVSKAVTAQRFASKLKDNKEEVIDLLKTAEEFKYLREAIYHVTKPEEA
jgi:putative ATP-dependent endonuclease of OLD family